MLEAGRLTATVTSKATGKHLTVTVKSLAKDGRQWKTAPFGEGTLHVVNEGDGAYGTERIGRFIPTSGEMRYDTQSAMLRYAAGAVLRAAFTGELETAQHVVAESNQCGRCGRDLTDPVSIERGVGPECFGKLTGAKSARAAALAEAVAANGAAA
jgi:hypothetical protein